MKIRWHIGPMVLFAACAGLFATSAAARDPLVLEPSSPWNLRYDEDKCRLVRVFGEGEQRVELNIHQSGIEPFFNIFLLGDPVKTDRRQQTISVQFGPHEESAERSFLYGRIGEEKVPFLMMHGIQLGKPEVDVETGEFETGGIGLERQRQIEWLAIGDRKSPALNLRLPDLWEAMAALSTCSEDLVQHLGLDAEGQSRIAEAPQMLNMKEMANTVEYPSLYQREGMEGHVKVRVTVNKDGEATNCQIARSSRPAVFDDVVCLAMIQTGKFSPAIDIEGNPAASYFNMEFTFQLS